MSAAELQIPERHWLTREEKRLVPVLQTKALRVLLIEDNREYAALVTQTLENQNLCEFEIERATQLDAAIEKLERSQFDAVLLDLTLPDANAETSIKLVCSRVSNFAVIVLTASEDTQLALLAGKAGADAFIRKDQLNRRTLPRKILDVVVQHRSMRPAEVSLDLDSAPTQFESMLEQAMLRSEPMRDGGEVRFPDELIFCDRLSHTIEQARAKPRRFAVLRIKLDHLDVLAGRSLRDEMLETAYLKLRDRISAADTLARIGESSFALILDDVANTASVNEIANALAGCISYARVSTESNDIAADSIGMTASVGVAMYPDDGRDLASLQGGAQAAQQSAALNGESMVNFCRDLDLYQDSLEKPLPWEVCARSLS